MKQNKLIKSKQYEIFRRPKYCAVASAIGIGYDDNPDQDIIICMDCTKNMNCYHGNTFCKGVCNCT